jgi:hypothetical protein
MLAALTANFILRLSLLYLSLLICCGNHIRAGLLTLK